MPRYQTRTCEDASIGMVVTHSYYYLAQVHGKLGHAKKSAELCHTTLARQLRYDRYEAVDWCANCATLSQFYINQDRMDRELLSGILEVRRENCKDFHIFCLDQIIRV